MPDVFQYYDSQPGFYLIVPFLAYHLGNMMDGAEVLRICQDIYTFLLFCCLPFLAYKLFKNTWGGVIAPVVGWFTWGILWQLKMSPYYSLAWGAILSFFLLVFLLKETQEKAIWRIVAAECVVVAMSNFIRSGSIVFCSVLTLAILFGKEWKKRKEVSTIWIRVLKCVCSRTLLVSAVCLFISSNILDTGIAKAVCKANGMQVTENSQPWHSLYIGLGFEENPYGIEYDDRCGMNKAKEREPEVVYHSELYFEIIKAEYFQILRENPGWFLASYIKKALLCVYDSVLWMFTYHNKIYWSGGTVLLAGWLLWKRKDVFKIAKRNWQIVLLFLALYLGGMIQGVMAVPQIGYIYGSMAMVGMILFLFSVYLLQNLLARVAIFVFPKRKSCEK